MEKIAETGTCALCGGSYAHFGNNPQPVLPEYNQRVCDDCNAFRVIPARLALITQRKRELADNVERAVSQEAEYRRRKGLPQ